MTVEVFKPTIKDLEDFKPRNPSPYPSDSLHLMLKIEDTVICVYSATEHETCVEVHLQISDSVRQYKELFHEMCLEMKKVWFDTYKNHDLIVMDVEPRNEEWAKRLGLQPDSDVKELETISGLKTYSLKRGDL